MAQPLPCPAWVFSNNSNVHVAKDRSWFGDDYTPLDSTLAGDDKTPVVGIGTVDLPVKRSPEATGPESHTTLRLRNVLHVPSTFCNILGGPIMEEYHVGFGGDENTKGTIMDKQDGRRIAYFDPSLILFQVKLSDPPVGPRVGPTPFEPSMHYGIGAAWADSERAKWEASRAPKALPSGDATDSLSAMEKQWLKENWGSEFEFLASHGLSIHKEEDREEGRGILRAHMKQDGDDGDENHLDSDNFDEVHPEGLLANSYFDQDELDFIKKSYGNAMNFMLSFGLKFYNTEDGEEAQAIVRALMHNDGDDYDDHDDYDDYDDEDNSGVGVKR